LQIVDTRHYFCICGCDLGMKLTKFMQKIICGMAIQAICWM